MAKNLSSAEFQEIGRRYFKQQQYEKAVEAFTDAIEAAVQPTVSQYDQRAASYDKLQDLNSALKDGRNMIKLDKQNIKGYLRTALLLQKMGKSDKALDIYKYGMKNVPITNKDFKILQQLHDQLTRKLSPATAFDPFTVLPLELAHMVMEHLTFREVVNCLRVSKGWKTFIIKCPRVWTDLDLSGARKDVSRIFVRNAVKYSEYGIHSATFHRFRHPDMLRNIATACKNLTKIEFRSGELLSATIIEVAQCVPSLEKLILNTSVTLDTIGQILRFRPTLEHAEFNLVMDPHQPQIARWKGPFPNLETLILQRISSDQWLRPFDAGDLFEQTNALSSLTLKGWESVQGTRFSTLPLTELVIHDLKHVGQLPKSLERLTYKSKRPDLQVHDLPRLTHLSIEGRCPTHYASYSDLLSGLLDWRMGGDGDFVMTGKDTDMSGYSKLQHLAIRNATPTNDEEHVVDLLRSSPRVGTKCLGSLDLTAWPVTDDDCEWLARNKAGTQHSLHTINLSRSNVTGAGVKDLVDNIPTLDTLILDGCQRITSRDIITYAEKKGIKVSMKMNETRGGVGGRTVRYG